MDDSNRVNTSGETDRKPKRPTKLGVYDRPAGGGLGQMAIPILVGLAAVGATVFAIWHFAF